MGRDYRRGVARSPGPERAGRMGVGQSAAVGPIAITGVTFVTPRN